MRVFISSPEHAPDSVEVQPGEALLLGRAPKPERLAAAGTERVVAHEWHDSRVSGNHALVSHDGNSIVVQDLNSRNGTWIRLAPGSSVRLDASDGLQLQLAGSSLQSRDDAPLPRAEWSEDDDFAEAVRSAIATHLEQVGLSARVVAGRGAAASALAGAFTFQLEDGSAVRVETPADLTADRRLPLALERIRSWVALENAGFRSRRHAGEGLILASASIREAHDQVEEAAQKGMRVVLLGPTGAGKERLARCYHEHSRQARGPFHAINCGQLSKDLIYAQLFGAKKGSFTGSTHDLIGAVQAASEGTLFLDEVSDMPKDVQSAVLRFLDRRGEYYRLGEENRVRTARNVQIVCATSADVHERLARGELREDLWYRIAERTVLVAPLAERSEDVLAFLKSALPGERREVTLERGLEPEAVSVYDALTPAALSLVSSATWPGNFRSLESFVLRLPARAPRQSISVELCRRALAHDAPGAAPIKSPVSARPTELSGERWHEVVLLARSAFESDEGTPATWGALVSFVERYLKPAFVAHVCGLEHAERLDRSTNLSELARQLDLKDGTTVKTHLLRYFARFAGR